MVLINLHYLLLLLLSFFFADSSPIRRLPSAAEMASADSPKLRVRTLASGDSVSRTAAAAPAATATSTTTTTAPLEPIVVRLNLFIARVFIVFRIVSEALTWATL